MNANINSQNNTALNLCELQDNGNSKHAYDIPTFFSTFLLFFFGKQ